MQTICTILELNRAISTLAPELKLTAQIIAMTINSFKKA